MAETKLREALELLRKDGWTKGMSEDPRTGRRCAVGALQEVHRLTPDYALVSWDPRTVAFYADRNALIEAIRSITDCHSWITDFVEQAFEKAAAAREEAVEWSEFLLPDAIALATSLHAGQLDKSGRPYVGHLERVADLVTNSGGTWVQTQAAWFHDAIEDTWASAEILDQHRVPRLVIDIVEVLTHPTNEPNKAYWDRIKHYEPAVLVKLCDIYDNLNPVRMCYLHPREQLRLRLKYAEAMVWLVGL